MKNEIFQIFTKLISPESSNFQIQQYQALFGIAFKLRLQWPIEKTAAARHQKFIVSLTLRRNAEF